eukprot:ANDGO_07590.mRNA.1 Replication protein A 70 kDa DNA-binding subunit A
MSLSTGVLLKIYQGSTPADPVVQLLELKKLENKQPSGGNAKLRVILSDGKYYMIGILSSQVVQQVDSGALGKFGIVRLSNYSCNDVQNKRVVIVLAVDVIQAQGAEQIGSPEKLDGAGTNSSNPGAQAPVVSSRTMAAAPLSAISATGNLGSTGQNTATSSFGASRPTASAPASTTAPAPAVAGSPAVRKGPVTPVSPSGSVSDSVVPIASLNMYHTKWAIKGRISSKTPIKRYSNAKGEGKLLNVTLADEHGGEIRITMFNDCVDRFGDLLVEGNVYIIARGQVKHANRKYSSVNNDYEIVLDDKSVIELVQDDNSIPVLKIDSIPIDQLSSVLEDSMVTIMGVVTSVGEVGEIISKKNGSSIPKRNIVVADQSLASVDVTIWGGQATTFSAQVGEVVALRDCKVSSYNGRTVSCLNQSSIVVEPKTDESYALHGWWTSRDSSEQIRNISSSSGSRMGAGGADGSVERVDRRKNLGSIQDDRLGFGDKPDWVTALATLTKIKSDKDMWYSARKSEQREDGSWKFDKCDPMDPQAERRYVVSLNLTDSTGDSYATAFENTAQVIVGDVSANDLAAYKENDPPTFSSIIQDALFKKYVFKLKIQAQTVNDEKRAKAVIVSATPVSWVDESRRMIDDLKRMM